MNHHAATARTKRWRAVWATGVCFALAVSGFLPTAAQASSPPAGGVGVVVDGLDNPRGIDPGLFPGTLLVAEAGRGGDTDCQTAPNPETGEDETYCLGVTGAVDLIAFGHKVRLAELPSIAVADGSFAGGPSDTALGSLGLQAIMNGTAEPGFAGDTSAFGKLLRVGPFGPSSIADIAAFESAENPDGVEIDSNAYGVTAYGRFSVVTDAGGNSLLKVRKSGHVSLLATFPDVIVPWPDGLPFGPPAGTPTPAQSVPTSVTVGPDDALYVGELTGFPFAVGAARVWRVVPGEAPTVYADGFTNIIDLQFDARGRLHVLEIAKNGLLQGMQPGGDLTGSLIRVNRNGSRTEVASAGLTAPGGVAIDVFGRIYVTNNSIFAGVGEVVRVK